MADTGAVTTWSWQPVASESAPLPHPFAWALIKLDGADTPLLHVVDAGAPSAIATGDRVKARWSEEPQASMHGIVAFDLIAPITDSAAPAPPTGPRGARP